MLDFSPCKQSKWAKQTWVASNGFTPLVLPLPHTKIKIKIFTKINLSQQNFEFFLCLGVSICLDRVSIETLNLDTGREPISTVEKNLDTFKILVSTIEKSWSRSRFLDLVSMAICKTSTSQPRSRFIETCQDFCDCLWFLWISWFFLDLDREITWFFTYIDRDIYINCRNLWKVVGEAQGKQRKVKVKPSPTTFHRCLKFKISQLMSRNLDNSR
jgi:hypothetical protein